MLLEHIVSRCNELGFKIRKTHGSQDFRKIDFQLGEQTPKGIEIIGKTKETGKHRVYGFVEAFSDKSLKEQLSDENICRLLGLR